VSFVTGCKVDHAAAGNAFIVRVSHPHEKGKTMKKTLLVAVLMAVASKGQAATDFIDTASVISSTPIVERVSEPRQECGPAPAAAPTPAQNRDLTGAIIGGVAGGLLGAQVGRGNGRTAAAAVGAAVGAIAGDSVQNSQRTATGPAQICHTVQVTREVTRGYTVVYQYSGRDVTVTLPYDPGPTVRVGIGIVDSAPIAAAPAADALGSNVRDVTPAPSYEPTATPVSTGGAGGYQYRY
jgi:uncharacterized protein YcfJ